MFKKKGGIPVLLEYPMYTIYNLGKKLSKSRHFMLAFSAKM